MDKDAKKKQAVYDRCVGFNLWQAVFFYLKFTPVSTLVMYLLKILFSLLPFLTVIISAQFVDRVLAMSRQGYEKALYSAFLTALLLLVREVGTNLYSFLRTKQWSRTYPIMDRMVTQKIAALPYEKIEDDRVQDILSRVKEDPEGLLSGIIEGYLELGGFLVSNVSLVAVLVTQAPAWVSAVITGLLLCIVAAFLPSGVTLYMQRNIYAGFQDTAAPLRRRYQAYKDCVTDRQYFRETRILGAASFFFGKAAGEWERLGREEVRVKTRSNLLNLFQNTVSLAGYLGALVLLVASVLNGSVSVGAFAAVYNSLNKLFDMMFDMVCGFIGSTVAELPEMENFVGFLDQGKKEDNYCIESKKSVEKKNRKSIKHKILNVQIPED